MTPGAQAFLCSCAAVVAVSLFDIAFTATGNHVSTAGVIVPTVLFALLAPLFARPPRR